MRTGQHLKPYQFKKGQSGNPNGAPQGERVRTAFFKAFKKTGDLKGLIEWINNSKDNRRIFYDWIVRLLPRPSILLDQSTHDNRNITITWKLASGNGKPIKVGNNRLLETSKTE